MSRPAAGADSKSWAQDGIGPLKGTAVHQLLGRNAGRCSQEAWNLDFYVKAPGFKMLVTQHTMCGGNKEILWAGYNLPGARCPPSNPPLHLVPGRKKILIPTDVELRQRKICTKRLRK